MIIHAAPRGISADGLSAPRAVGRVSLQCTSTARAGCLIRVRSRNRGTRSGEPDLGYEKDRRHPAMRTLNRFSDVFGIELQVPKANAAGASCPNSGWTADIAHYLKFCHV